MAPADQLREPELVKVKELCEDVMRFGTWVESGRLHRSTWLGRVFNAFESLMVRVAAPVHALARTIKRLLRRPRSAASRLWDCHVAPRGSNAAPSQCATEFHIFDGLSQIHDGNFRGSVVANCGLGLAASSALLLSLSPPFGLQALIDHFHDHVVDLPAATIIELICIGLIWGIYLRGRTPERDDDEDPEPVSMQPHLTSQRWHERWLEYRLLAERFRYVDLVLPLGVDAARGLSIAPPHDAARMWHQRYFEARLARVRQQPLTVTQYRDHVLAVMAEQEKYHVANHHRRGAIAQLLHTLAKGAFIAGFSICVVDIVLSLSGADHASRLSALSCVAADSFKTTLLFFAALFPVLSAATYAIVTHAEYAKVADASGELYERAHELYASLAAIPVPEAPANEQSLAAMRPIVLEFATMAITEATGWRAMLRDKNVPLL